MAKYACEPYSNTMSLAVVLHPLANERPAMVESDTISCHLAQKACAPAYVFSISGQVNFRRALAHLTRCQDPTCKALQPKIVASMRRKLRWLLEEDFLLGCIHLQPHLYGATHIIFRGAAFSDVAGHLSRCPHESCAQLRRALLLTIRTTLRPHLVALEKDAKSILA